VILTGAELAREVADGRVVIEPFDPALTEPNSYGFHLGTTLVQYDTPVLDPTQPHESSPVAIPPEGYVLQPGRFYLCQTAERMGSDYYAATLYANRSVSCLGIWIQLSAPLGHSGAIIPWTLEITVVHPVRVYAGMRIGKIAFWRPQGEIVRYAGKYADSRQVEPSRLVQEMGAGGEQLLVGRRAS
jgi:dCTP deaminase